MKHFVWILLFAGLGVTAQEKKVLTHEDYDRWESLRSVELRKDGRWVTWSVEPQRGDGTGYIKRADQPAELIRFTRGKPTLVPGMEFAVVEVEPPYLETRKAKIKGKKGGDLPKSSLVLMNLETGNLDTLGPFNSWSLAEDHSPCIAWIHDPVKPADTAKAVAADSMASIQPKEKEEKAEEEEKEETEEADKDNILEIIKLETGELLYSTRRVKITKWSDDGNWLFYWRDKGDSLYPRGLTGVDLRSGTEYVIDTQLWHLGHLVFSGKRNTLYFVSSMEPQDKEEPVFSLYSWKPGRPFVMEVPPGRVGLPEHWAVSGYASLKLNEDEDKLFLGTRPIPYEWPKDTLTPESEKVEVDVWHWQDPYIQPMQLQDAEEEKRRSYLAVLHLDNDQLVQLADEEWPEWSLDTDEPGNWAILTSDLLYREQLTWSYPIPEDAVVVNLRTGGIKDVYTAKRAHARLSPGGRYVTWFDQDQGHWFLYDINSSRSRIISKGVPYSLADEDHDTPSPADAYGSAGWTEKDGQFLFYDRYDIWAYSPKSSELTCLTGRLGRKQGVQYRYTRVREEEKTIPSTFWISGFNEESKDQHLVEWNLKNGKGRELARGPHTIYDFRRAEEADRYLLRTGTYEDYPQLQLGGEDLRFETLSSANAFQSEYNWGRVELVNYTSATGKELQGLLYKPENFDAAKKYPLLVYFYERSSDELHSYRSPSPSASVINFPYFNSNGYCIFVPDIVYEVGHPGQSAYDCIIPGVKKLMAEPWIDGDRMALQGQSWGGYQTAWLITRTDSLFACAMAGAPVSNMISAYGGIRWGSGMSRMFQYEQSQSRIGATLWEAEALYRENSPIFFAPNVKTPLLMMHNDGDGAVPWYQGIEYYMALRRLHKPVWLLVYNGEEHNLEKRHNRMDLSRRMAQFFDHYLKGAPMPAWMEYGIPAVDKGKDYGFQLNEE